MRFNFHRTALSPDLGRGLLDGVLRLRRGPRRVGGPRFGHARLPREDLGGPLDRANSLHGAFSAVSNPNFSSKYAFESSRRDLHNALFCIVLQHHIIKICCQTFTIFLFECCRTSATVANFLQN